MYCKNCGKLLETGDKFCSNCGTRVSEDFVPAFRQEEQQETPRPVQAAPQQEERPKRKFHIEEFNWDLDGYPTARKKTEDIDFNWSSVLEEKRRDAYGAPKTEAAPKAAEAEKAAEGAADAAAGKTEEEPSLEDALFADMGSLEQKEPEVDNEEPTRILAHRENRTEFYTYNKKNEALQAMLDREYEKLKSGGEPEDAPETGRAEDGRSPEQVMADLLDEAEPAAGADAGSQEAGGQPENPPSKEEKEVALEFVGVTLSQAPKGVLTEDAEAALQAAAFAEAPALSAAAEKAEPAEPAEPAETAAAETARKEAPQETSGPETAQEEAKAEKTEQQPPRRKETQPEEHKLTFDDVFGDDDDSEEAPKKGRALKVIAAILCVLVAAELVMIGIQYFAPESEAAKAINGTYRKVIQLFSGEESQAEPEPAVQPEPEEGPLAALIEEQKEKGKNIALIEEDQSLTFADGEDYGFEDFAGAYTFDDKPWYTEDGRDVTYGQELVAALVQYYSLWIDKINGKNSKVLDVIDQTSDLYEEIDALEGEKDLEYGMNRLAIGEIRVGNTGFYVRTAVTIVDSKNRETQEDHIVYMEPDEKAMKLVAVKKI